MNIKFIQEAAKTGNVVEIERERESERERGSALWKKTSGKLLSLNHIKRP